jgi:hypothetical protein
MSSLDVDEKNALMERFKEFVRGFKVRARRVLPFLLLATGLRAPRAASPLCWARRDPRGRRRSP